MIKIYDFDSLGENDYAEIKKRLKSSGIIIYPTETSYAIGANAFDDDAVRKIYAMKGRDSAKPLPVLVKDLAMLLPFAEVARFEEDIISKFWPGPLTIIFKLKPAAAGENYLFTAGSKSAAARISPHPFTERLFKEIDFPLISTSANAAGKDSFSDFAELNEKFLIPVSKAFADTDIAAIDCKILPGGSSTVIRARGKNMEIIREGDNNIAKRLICSIKNSE